MSARNLILTLSALSLMAALGAGIAADRYAPARSADPAPAPVEKVADGRIQLPKPEQVGDQPAVVSLLDVKAPMQFGDYLWNEDGVPAGETWVRVDLKRQLISVFRGGAEIGTAVILYGGEGKDTPHGVFPVLQKAVAYHSKTYDAPMPYMVRLTADGVAIHASNVRKGWATHGCIGVPEPFARKVFDAMKLGDRVFISDEAAPAAQAAL